MDLGHMDFALDRLLNFPNITVEKYRIEEDKINLNIGFINEIVICPCCTQTTDEIHQKRKLSVRDLPILGKSTVLEIDRRQYYCQNCQKYFTESLDFIDFDRHSTNRYKQYIYERVKTSNITQITREENLSYDRVKSIFESQFLKKKKCQPQEE